MVIFFLKFSLFFFFFIPKKKKKKKKKQQQQQQQQLLPSLSLLFIFFFFSFFLFFNLNKHVLFEFKYQALATYNYCSFKKEILILISIFFLYIPIKKNSILYISQFGHSTPRENIQLSRVTNSCKKNSKIHNLVSLNLRT